MTPKKTLPKWIKFLFIVTCFGVLIGLASLLFRQKASDVIEEQLSKIRESKITQAYYDFTALDFQAHTSLDAFREFVNSYPVLAHNKNFTLTSTDVQDNKAVIKGVLTSDSLHEMDVVYRLIKDDDKWKILHVKLEDLAPKTTSQSTLALVNKVSNQIKAFQKNDFTDAYYGFVSKDFQNQTPIESFKQFILAHPILYRYKGFEIIHQAIHDNQGVVEVLLTSDQGEVLLDYRLVRENDDWKIWNLKLNLSPEEAEKEAFTNPKAMEPPVRAFLDYLLKNNVLAAYEITAKEFQDVTSFESFKDFVAHHTAFSDRDLRDIKNGSIDDGVGMLSVNLHNDSGITTVLFRMGFENGQWKIWGVEVPKTPTQSLTKKAEPIQDSKSKTLSKKLQAIAQDHLRDLRYHNIADAYSSMSENYKMRHNLESFENYLQKNPIFNMNKSSEFNRISLDKKHIALQGKLTTFEAETYPFKYQLVKEGKNWKIDHFAVLKHEEPVTENEFALNDTPLPATPLSMQIAGIKIGTQADSTGRLSSASQKISKDAPFIYINVSIKNGVEGTVLKAILEHVESASSAPWLATSLESNGDYVVVFSYAMPTNGWPTGQYIIKITSITGQEAIQKFMVE